VVGGAGCFVFGGELVDRGEFVFQGRSFFLDLVHLGDGTLEILLGNV
jgi:hypothetical protein